MKKWKAIFLILFLFFILGAPMGSRSVKAETESPKNVYVKRDGKLYFYDTKGNLVKGFFTSASGKLYYFDINTGEVKTGMITVKNKQYYIGEKGLVFRGWLKYQKKNYYCDAKTGEIRKGWYHTSNYDFYFGTDGVIKSGFVKVDGSTYYFTNHGRMVKNSWVTYNDQKFYLNSKGKSCIGWKTIDGNTYYFGDKGVMQTGWLKLGTDTYYLNQEGVMQTGWVQIRKKYYSFNQKTGKLQRNCWVNKKYVGEQGYWIRNYDKVLYSVCGTSNVTVDQLVAAFKEHGVKYPRRVLKKSGAGTITRFCTILYEEAVAEGIKPEVVFAQAMLETGWLQFGGDVSVKQNNFAGIGATGGGVPGNSFPTVRIGLRAQIQHLKAYSSTLPLNKKCVDPRFTYVDRGLTPYVEWLGAKENPNGYGWAMSDDYGIYIMSIIRRIIK